jgi:hypothetical protein
MNRPSTRFIGLVLMAWTSLGQGCGDNTPASTDHRRNVMVIDTGFDPSLPVFDGRVVATYTVACRAVTPSGDDGNDGGMPPDADGGADGGPSPFDDAKQAMLAALAAVDDSCQLRADLTPAPNPFGDLEESRASFNAAIRSDMLVGDSFQASSFDATYNAIAMRLPTASFHGTATSSVVADENPTVKLVLVQIQLGEPSDVESMFTCFEQATVDQTVALLTDPDVRAAYVQRPLDPVDQALADARALHGVGLVNESFGATSRYQLQMLQQTAHCPFIDLRSYFQVLGDIDVARAQAHAEPGVLVVQSAGNDGAQVDGPADSLDCQPGEPDHLLIGSYGFEGKHSYFTNFGGCVDAYAPGEDVIGHLPGDWLFPLAGTSFSAPLVVRWLSMTAPQPFDPATARADLVTAREPNRNLLPSHFPRDVLYDPSGRAYQGATGALTVAGAPAPPPAPGLAGGIDVRALQRALWPLRLTQRRANQRPR